MTQSKLLWVVTFPTKKCKNHHETHKKKTKITWTDHRSTLLNIRFSSFLDWNQKKTFQVNCTEQEKKRSFFKNRTHSLLADDCSTNLITVSFSASFCWLKFQSNCCCWMKRWINKFNFDNDGIKRTSFVIYKLLQMWEFEVWEAEKSITVFRFCVRLSFLFCHSLVSFFFFVCTNTPLNLISRSEWFLISAMHFFPLKNLRIFPVPVINFIFIYLFVLSYFFCF